jgi:hypothetical protein
MKKRKAKSAKQTAKQTVRVQGHWVYPLGFNRDGSPKKGYYVKPYKYQRKSTKGKPHKKHLTLRDYPGRRHPPVPKGYVLDYTIDTTEAEERVTYTFKIEALVEYQGRYVTRFSLDKDLKGEKSIEYYHTKFEPTIEAAKVDFHGQIAILKAYGHLISWMSIDLYRVSGIGALTDKQWKLIRSYDEPEAVK